MVASDGTFDATSEGVEATIDTSGFAPGHHILYVRGTDAAGWTNDPASTCSAGTFVVGTPTEIVNGGVTTQLGGDHATGSGNAFYSAVNTGAGTNDIDGGLPSNGEETCDAGSCQAGTPVACDDGVACTADACDEAADACDFAPDDALCDDGAYCTGVETCDQVAGCQEGADPCTGLLCDEGADVCVECFTGADCDDGLFCTGVETCNAGACVAGGDPCPGLGYDEDADVCLDVSPALWMSFRSNTAVPGIGTVADEDVVSYDELTGTWELQFDGSDLGLSSFEIDGLAILPGGDLLLSFRQAGTFGASTAGTFSLRQDLTAAGIDSTEHETGGSTPPLPEHIRHRSDQLRIRSPLGS